MSNKIYLGNLSKEASKEAITERFAEFGEVMEVIVPLDRKSDAPKGYGFVTFKRNESAEKAIALDGTQVLGSTLTVQIATEKGRGKKA